MNTHWQIWLGIALLLTCGQVTHAQDDAALDEQPEPAAAVAQPAAPIAPKSTIPAVLAVLETNPTTPMELFRAAEIVTDLGDLPVAKELLEKLLAASPTDDQLADLWERYGSARFIRFKAIAELNPEATDLAAKIQAAAEKRTSDPARLATLLTRLQSPEPDEQRAAIELLRTGRGAAVNALLQVLADPTKQSEHASARRAIKALGHDGFGPLVAALDAENLALRQQVVACLAESPREEARWYLIAPSLDADSPAAVSSVASDAVTAWLGHSPSVTEGAAILFNRAQAYYDRRVLLGESELAPVEIWTWDAVAGKATKLELPPHDAGLHYAERLARDARRLAPQERSVQTLYFGALLEAAQAKAGWNQPLPDGPGTAIDELKQAGADVASALLSESLKNGHPAAALNAVRVLGDLGDASALQQGSAPSPLVEAVRSDDRRVRFMAVRSILKLQPREVFPGSSYVTQGLESFLRTAGEPRAVVACPKLAEAQRLAGLLMEAGYDAESVDILGEVQRVVNASSDCELLLIDVRYAALTSGELLAKLRRDPRTAKLPIGVVYSPYDRANPTPLDSAGGIVVTPDDQQIVEKLARRFTGIQPIMRPQEAAGLTAQLEWLLAPKAASAVSKDERLNQAKYALAWTRQLAEQPGSPFTVALLEPVVRPLLGNETFTADAAATLAMLGTASGQSDLVELASNASAPMPQREIAAQAFADGVKRHGILLTTGQIGLQYDRYNASATADEATQKLLGGVLDAIESAGKR